MQGKTPQRKVMMLFLALPVFLLPGSKALAAGRQQLSGHMPQFVKENAPLQGHVDPSRIFHLHFALPSRNPEELQGLLQQLTDPQSPLYRHWLSVEEYTDRFGPTQADYQTLQDFLTAHHFTIEKTFANRRMVSVVGASADVEKTLHVTMNDYQRPDGTTFYSADREPSVDLEIPLGHISGLDNAILPRSRGFYPISNPNKVIQANGSASGGACYWGNDFRHAYAANVTLTGAGQTNAIVALDNYYPADISTYIKDTGIAANASAVTNLYYSGITSTTTPNDGGETSLDIEDTLAMAPGLQQLRVYLGTNGDQLLTAIASDNIAKSCSLCFLWSPYSTTAEDDFVEMQTQGQSFYAAAGDSGAYPTSGSNSTQGWLEELSSICVVGGTLLTMNGTGASWASETTWSGGGGGISPDITIPAYQSPVPMTTNYGSTTHRNIPDVSIVADYVTIIYQQGTTLCLGGTSCAAPLWNGFTALVNQQAALVGQPTMGFPNTPIYKIGLGPDYTLDFHDITTGNNGSATMYPAVAGYDLATGWGSPYGQTLINDLAGVGNPTPTPTLSPTITATPTSTPTASALCPNWAVVGNAVLGTAVTLTTATNAEAGAAWNKTCISLSQNFNLMFKAYFGASTSGADGIDFVLQNDPRGTAAIGGGGSDKGYSGGTPISPSVAFTLETYGSNGTLQPEENGNTANTCTYVLSGTCPYIFANPVDNGVEHTYNVVWNASAETLTLYFDGSAVMTYTRNLVSSVFGGASCVYYGFTAGTGGANNLQYVYAINCLTSANTPTNSPTNSPTATRTKTSTPSPTPTATLTFTRTNSPTATQSSTPTSTSTAPTATSTPTSSPSLTATGTATKTPTPSATSTATATNTSTASSSMTATPSLTGTATASLTPTISLTPTGTPSNSPVNTATPTATATSTHSTTPTPTSTNTSTRTPTLTNTATGTSTVTATATNTSINTPTITSTYTPTNTPTKTPSVTSTSTPTNTKTPTPTFTPTFTPTSTATSTPTQPLVQASKGSSAPPNQTVLSGASDVSVIEVGVSNQSGEAVGLSSLVLTVSGTGNSSSGISALQVVITGTGTPVTLTVVSPFASSNSVTISLSGTVLASGASGDLSVSYTLSPTASGTFSTSATGLTGQGEVSGKPIQVTGLPVAGAVLTVNIPTATTTPTSSFTPVFTVTSTATPSFTSTPSIGKTPVLYPNPVTGPGPVNVLVPLTSVSNVRVEIFTTAFRMVQEETFQSVSPGEVIALTLTDKFGNPLANGLYYVVIKTQGKEWILKLLIVR